jgi:dTDP-4-amino-4,6-dideoxygalactose transaminase
MLLDSVKRSGSGPGRRSPRTQVEELAGFGGAPLFPEPLHVGKPAIPDRDRLFQRISEALDRRWLTNAGPLVRQLEERIAALLGVRHCLAVANGTIGLEMAARALGLRGEVLVPAYTFVATAHALEWIGLRPVFCDVDPRTHSLDPESAAARITKLTTGIVGVHVWGRPCNTEALTDLARRHNLRLMFDAAHAFGCAAGARMIGNFGDAEVFSFHATKFFHTFEGGAVVTNDDDLAQRLRLLRNFGFAGYDSVVAPGTNGKMSEISAAMGLTGLDTLDDLLAGNREKYVLYRDQLSGLPGLRLYVHDDTERRNFQYLVAEIEKDAALSRDEVVKLLHAENILARRYFYPGCHRMEPYASRPEGVPRLPAAEDLCERVLVLPTGAAVTPEDITLVCSVLKVILGNGHAVANRLRKGAAETSL